MRTTKLMALLLAALMVVTAFAGCASGVKQEAFDGLEDRVEALEGKIDGVDSSIKELGDKIPTDSNKEQLDQITDTLGKITESLGKLEDRVGEVENKPVTGGATADEATKAAAQAATAKIEIKKNEFAKNADKYTEADYAAILEALGKAGSAVAAATTVAEVDKAMADLEATLDQYMTYAMKAYDYYTQLLGKLDGESVELIDEVIDFLDDVADYYDGKDSFTEDDLKGKVDTASTFTLKEYEYELLYLAVEATKEANNQYINIYKALETFVEIFDGKSSVDDGNYIYYVTEKNKVDYYDFGSIAYYEKLAEAIVDDIDELVGEELIYSVELEAEGNELDKLFDKYDDYVEAVEPLGGDALVDLITNADALVAAEDAFDNLIEAVKAFAEATVVSRTVKKDVFYYYDVLLEGNGKEGEGKVTYEKLLQYYDEEEDEYVWVADVYEQVDELLADWIDAYDLSDENVNAIIEAKKDEGYYTLEDVKYTATNASNTYVANKHYNGLLVAACEEFKDDILPLIEDLNGATATSVQLALDFSEIEDLIDELKVLQEKDKDATYPANIALDDISAANMAIIYKEADLFADMKWDEDVEDARYAAIAGVVDLFTFEADVDQLEDKRNAPEDDDDAAKLYGYYFYNEDDEDAVDNRKAGDIYKFFGPSGTYAKIKADAKTINDKIAAFVEAVEDNALANNLTAFELSGDYVKLEGTVEKPVEYDGTKFTTTVYVALDDYLKDIDKDLDEYMDGVAASASIAAFVYHNEDFEALLDTADFEAAKKTITDHIEALFADIDAIVELVEDVDYVRDGATIYEDLNKNGKYDEGEEVGVTQTVAQIVSLNDAAAVKAAVAAYNKWVGEGGSTNIAYFGTYVDEEDVEYDDVFTMNGLGSAAVTEINEALELLDELDAAIQLLEEKADHFVKAVANAKAVQSGSNPFKVTASENHFASGSDVAYYAWISRTLSTSENTDASAGSYKYVVKDKEWTTATNSNEKSETYKKNTTGYLNNVSLKKIDLVKAIVDLYVDFKAANIDYVADADNDYETEGAKLYYQIPQYVAYKAFDDAVKNYEAIDLLSVKGYILSVTDANKTDAAVAAFRSRILNESKDLATLQNFVYQYNLSAGANAIYADKLAEIAIYNFTRLVKPQADIEA